MADKKRSSMRILVVVALLNFIGFGFELAGGLLFGSVALLSDAMHMFFDGFAYSLAVTAIVLATRWERSDEWSFGFHRLEPLSAFLNGLLLVPMVGYILYESYQRILHPSEMATISVLLVAGFGLVINLVSVYILEGDDLSLNEKGALYHLLGDAGASVAVIITTVGVQVTGVTLLDPLTAILISIGILWSAIGLIRGSGAIFLQKSPISQDDLRHAIEQVESVDTVDDIHVWSVCSQMVHASVHIRASGIDAVEEVERVRSEVHQLLREKGVVHATVEIHPLAESETVLRNHGHDHHRSSEHEH